MSINIKRNQLKRVVIVGGGLGGLRLAEDLSKANLQVVLIDKNNFHQFPPLIYQIASAGIDPKLSSFRFHEFSASARTSTSAWQKREPYSQTRRFCRHLSVEISTIIWCSWQVPPNFSVNASYREMGYSDEDRFRAMGCAPCWVIWNVL